MIDDTREIQILEAMNKKLSAILALMVERESSENGSTARHKRRPAESILAAVGLKAPEIAKILGKKQSAVWKAIERSRSRA
jgi:hypothetical protein